MAVALPLLTTSALGILILCRKLTKRPLTEEQEAKLEKLLKRYKDQLIPSAERLAELEVEFQQQMKEGLAKQIAVDGKHMMMLPTYVTRLPDGTETGECFALDLGGTNFRVMHVRLGSGRGQVEACDVQEVALPREVYEGSGQQLFDFLATTLRDFIWRHSAAGNKAVQPVLGFCFSFAVEQSGLASGKLLDWTKGFKCSGVVGHDPVKLLSAALERAGCPCRVLALLNDTVGVLAAQRYLDHHTDIGVIIGTGTNACYVEDTAKLTKWRPPAAAAAGGGSGSGSRTAVNMEWGAFFSVKLPRCMEDLQVDASSPNPGKYLFEKLLSGMFLGEAARTITASIAKELPHLFAAAPEVAAAAAAAGAVAAGAPVLPGKLNTPGALSSKDLADIVDDKSWRLRDTRDILADKLGVHRPTVAAAEVVREVCTIVAKRSASLAAMALLAILRFNGWAAAATAAVKAAKQAAAAAAAAAAAPAAAAPGAAAPAAPAPAAAVASSSTSTSSGVPAPRPVTVAFDGGVYEGFYSYRHMLRAALREQLGEQADDLAPLIRFELSHDGSSLGAAVLAAAAAAEVPAAAEGAGLHLPSATDAKVAMESALAAAKAAAAAMMAAPAAAAAKAAADAKAAAAAAAAVQQTAAAPSGAGAGGKPATYYPAIPK
ncbi:hypothetical protein HYH02_002282 [Chlamydomonas schloesseri]|uniref:hexokinase n=1 Tax=Chlamydomonas schloesseri TaxID=2026947 RepID=A0A836BBG0_9CHLO|nr:hypothetical protein HYH02_002282 [Chlamydomonas schloesseri]|eukprot:KAG2452945.1 hypothetical protein HYH02_002282 [Chlamydomonas schloesseri]